MKVTRKLALVDTTNKMTVAFDIGKSSMNYYSEVEGKLAGNNCRETKVIQGSNTNSVPAVTEILENLMLFGRQSGFDGLHVVCEPTGSYSDRLLRLARQLGCTTALISGEAVSKAKVIEDNCASKNDIKDPRVIFMLSKMGRDLLYRQLPPLYQALREYNRAYDGEDGRRSQCKTEMQSLIDRLFCDFPMGKDFIFSTSGAALVQLYGFNPYKIAVDSYRHFATRMRKKAPAIRSSTLEDIYEQAQVSIRLVIPEQVVEAIEQRLRNVWEDYVRADGRRQRLREQIAELYEQLRAGKDLVPVADEKVFKSFHLGRILGETGPLSDFASWRTVLKYLGLNLRTRESGRFRGKLKLSKKGRTTGRLVLGRLAFSFIRRTGIYGEYYHSRKDKGAQKAKLIANIERKLVRVVFALARQGAAFNSERFGKCESQYAKAA